MSLQVSAADLRAGAIDGGAALMLADVVLQAIAELPGGRDLIANAMARKMAEVAAFPTSQPDVRASMLVMRGIVEDAIEPLERTAA